MKEKLMLVKQRITSFWKKRSKGQKGLMVGSVIAFVLILCIASIFASTSKMVPLYNDLSLQEIGQVKAELDTRGVVYELDHGGTTILVPEAEAESLLVDLAAAGLPNSGSIDYSFFSANTSWGMTDSEFDVIKLDAMQTELASLMAGITGIEDAQVMINMPEEQIFASENQEPASASIVLNVQPGYKLENNQVEALYNLASKSVPNLPKDNIVIMDQNFQYYDLNNSNNLQGEDSYTYQQSVKEDIERDIKQRVQRMLGMMIGQQKVIATVTADIDFTQEQRVEELVEPVNPETMEGLPVSVERIEETYEGGLPEGGIPGAGEEDIANYPAGTEGTAGDYEMTRETINYEFNRIKRNIQEAPYKVRDLGIQVAIDSTKGIGEDGAVETLTAEEQQTVEEGVQSILNSMITTSIDGSYGEVNPEDKVSIVFQEFSGQTTEPESGFSIPLWMYALGAVLAAIIAVLIWMLVRKRNADSEEYEDLYQEIDEKMISQEVPEIKEKETEATQRRKQLEKMAKDKPEEFAKLLRSWIAED